MRIRMVTAVRISVQQAAVMQLGKRICLRTARRYIGEPRKRRLLGCALVGKAVGKQLRNLAAGDRRCVT